MKYFSPCCNPKSTWAHFLPLGKWHRDLLVLHGRTATMINPNLGSRAAHQSNRDIDLLENAR